MCSRSNAISSSKRPYLILLAQSGSVSKARPTPTRSNSSFSSLSTSPSIGAASELSPPMPATNSPVRPTDPTVIVGKPVSFFVQPAKFKSEPSNSGSQKRRVEQSKQSIPASIMGFRKAKSLSGSVAILWSKSCCFHCDNRIMSGKSLPTAARDFSIISTAKAVRSSNAPPYSSSRIFVPSQKNVSIR